MQGALDRFNDLEEVDLVAGPRQGESAVLSLSQLSVLTVIGRDGPMTPTELAQRESVQPPSMTRIITSLIEAGLAQRLRHPTDGRQALISLTDRGREAAAAENSARDGWLAQQLATLAPGQLDLLRCAVPMLNALISAQGSPSRSEQQLSS